MTKKISVVNSVEVINKWQVTISGAYLRDRKSGKASKSWYFNYDLENEKELNKELENEHSKHREN